MTTLAPTPQVDGLPEAARRYLRHTVAPGTPHAREVRLQMHGEIRVRGWVPFEAEERIRQGRGMSWNARTRIMGLPVRGFDRVAQGYGQTEWWLLGLVPVVFGRGPDVNRSVIDRMAAESVWLPSALLGPEVRWSSDGPDEAIFAIVLFGRTVEVSLGVSATGSLETVSFMRWGNPGGMPFGLYPFGGYVEEESTFGGFTVPSRLRLGWHFGTDLFDAEGEFFRATVDKAEYGV